MHGACKSEWEATRSSCSAPPMTRRPDGRGHCRYVGEILIDLVVSVKILIDLWISLSLNDGRLSRFSALLFVFMLLLELY